MRALVIVLVLCAVVDAAPQQDEGRAIVFVVDRALNAAKVEVVRQAVKKATYRDSDQIGVIAYDAKTAMVVLPLTGGKSRAVRSTTESTNLVVGLEAAHAMLLKSKRARLVIVVTDSESTAGVEAVIAKMGADNITVSAVGPESANERALKTIATAGKGRHYKTDDSTGVAIAFQKELNRPPPGEETFAYVFVIDRALGPPALEAAKEIARVRCEALTPNDFVAVVAFDTAAVLHVRPQRAANRMRIAHDISRITTATSSSPQSTKSGLQLAFDSLKTLSMSDKHVVLLGTGRGEDIIDVIKAMAAAEITVSAVGVRAADRAALEELVRVGNGQLQMLEGMKLRMR